MTGRIFAITGASGVLGSAVAKAVAECGARVALIDFADHAEVLKDCGPDALMLGGVATIFGFTLYGFVSTRLLRLEKERQARTAP